MKKRNPGERALITGMTIDSLGSGMYVPFSLVFFEHVTGLPLTVIGAVLTGAGLAGMALLPLAGAAVDRFGARRMQLIGYTIRGLGFAAYPLATSLPLFALVALFTATGDRAFPAIQQAIVGEVATGADRDRLNALARSLRNAGLGAGGLIASLIIALAGNTGFEIAAWLNAASFFIAALIARLIPRRAATARATTPASYREVLRDRPFLGLVGANFLIYLGYAALTVLLPAYALGVLHAPAATVGTLFAVNTAICAIGGVPVSRFARSIGRRTRTAAVGAVIFAAAFVGFALVGTLRPATTSVLIALLIATTVLYTAGELLHSPAASTLAIAVAPVATRGRYLATYQLAASLSMTLAPSLFTALLAVDGRLPWLFLVGSVLTGAALMIWLERYLPAEATSPASTAASTTPAAPLRPVTPARGPVTPARTGAGGSRRGVAGAQ